MNLLNEEIRAIQHTINHLRMGIPLEPSQGKRMKMESDLNDLNKLLEEKLEQCGEYHG